MRWFWRTEDVYAPLPDWANGALIGHRDSEGRDMDQRIGWPAIHRLRFDRETFNREKVSRGTLYENCTFVHCTFEGELALRFHKCRFIDCNFLCGNALGLTAIMMLTFDWCEIRGRTGLSSPGDWRGSAFSHVRLYDSLFSNCLLDRVKFGNTVAFENLRAEQVQGLPSCTGLHEVQVAERGRDLLNGDLTGARIGALDRFASWERLRTFGRLPLFGTSLTALVAIPVVFYGLAIYNDQLGRLRHWASQDGIDRQLADMLLTIQPLPLPALSFWLLLATLLLGIGSTLFALACPPRVREFSLERWTDELRQSALRYLPLSWSGRWARAIAAPCYVIGGLGTVLILLVKLRNAAEFILDNSTLPW